MKFLLKNSILAFVMFFAFSAKAQLVQKHSFTFDKSEVIDGKPYVIDDIGGVKGELIDNVTVQDGVLKLSGGYVNIEPNSLNISEYESVTVECFFKQSPSVTGFRAVFSIGNTQGTSGVDYLLFQPTRGDNIAQLAIVTGDYSTQTSTKNYVNGDMFTDTRTHYMVAIVTASEITLYMDGNLMGSSPLTGTNSLSMISSEKAYLGWSTWSGDPKWQGTIEEFNIYEGAMTSDDVEQRFLDYMGENYFNPYLKSLSATPGELVPEFEPEIDYYDLVVPYSARYVTINAETMIDFATIGLYDAAGNTLNLGQPVAVGSDDFYIDIITTAADGATSGGYYITVVHEGAEKSANLESINLSAGEVATFHTDSLKAFAILPSGTTSVDITGVPMWEKAVVTNPSTVDVSSGSGEAQIVVTSEDGTATMTYTVELYVSKFAINKDLFIQNEVFELVISERSENENAINLELPMLNDNRMYYHFEESGVEGQYFVRNKKGRYLAISPVNAWSMQMIENPTQDADSSRFIIKEIAPNQFHIYSVARLGAANSKYSLAPDANSVVGSGIYIDKALDFAYNVWNLYNIDELVDPYNTYLENLEVNDVSIYPNFNRTIREYFMVVDKDVTELQITALPVDETAKITGAGIVAIAGDEGEVVVKVEAASASQYFTEYKLRFKREMPFELRHSYTFADGTARDVVGDAHGTIHGGYIVDGQYIAEVEGDHITLDAEKIAINEYTSLTLELFFTAGDETNGGNNTMIVYLGDTHGSYGVNHVFMHHKSRLAVSCLDLNSPWGNEDGINAKLFDDGMPHHFVATMNNGEITFYADGTKMGVQELRASNKIFNLSNAAAYIAKGGYTGDVTWKGGVLEYNIYSGEMDEAMVASRSINFPIEDGTADLSLADILVNEESLADFYAYKYEYEVELAENSETPVVSATAANPEATVEVTQAAEFPGVATIKVSTTKGEITYTVAFVGEEEPGTKVEKVEKDKIVVYPTVSSGSFTLAAGANAGSYVVYDLVGNVAGSASFQGGDVEISVANNGIYLLQVNINNKVYTMKIVKK